ncbi:MAG TPA: hypothetical protein VH601_25065 [Bryobacteraceae bacterium]
MILRIIAVALPFVAALWPVSDLAVAVHATEPQNGKRRYIVA